MIYWNIVVRGVDNVEWEHRICYDGHQFWGVENLYPSFSPQAQWTVFLNKIFIEAVGSVTVTNKDGETSNIRWIKE